MQHTNGFPWEPFPKAIEKLGKILSGTWQVEPRDYTITVKSGETIPKDHFVAIKRNVDYLWNSLPAVSAAISELLRQDGIPVVTHRDINEFKLLVNDRAEIWYAEFLITRSEVPAGIRRTWQLKCRNKKVVESGSREESGLGKNVHIEAHTSRFMTSIATQIAHARFWNEKPR
jgi:hypothetical protein